MSEQDLLTKVEAAIFLNIGCELIDYFVKKCPKNKENRKLKIEKKDKNIGPLFSKDELLDFGNYLREPWPLPKGAKRPRIPESIKKDIRIESHYCCAICGNNNHGEIAHIEPVSETMDNSPANLLFLCPNHHTEYDYGYKVSSNISINEISSAKLIKQQSRNRMLKYESNTVKLLNTVLKLAVNANKKLEKEENEIIRETITTDLRELIQKVPQLLKSANEMSTKDESTEKIKEALVEKYQSLSRATIGISDKSAENELRTSASGIKNLTDDLLFDFDEVDCPHCEGFGAYGLHEEYCKYCKGDCYVTEEEADNYDPEKIDERNCPHCDGRGQYGFRGDFCIYCKGSCKLSIQEYDDYDESEVDEVNCPHCDGRGQYGLNGEFCKFCHGSCLISKEEADSYEEDEVDEVECPHCKGKGTTGLVGDFCGFCKGSCHLSQEEADSYNEDEIDEIDCPHCGGRGTTGIAGDYCAFCGGSCCISQEQYNSYDEDEIDEVDCPNCGSRGMVGEYYCPTCKGSCVLTKSEVQSYNEENSCECPNCDGQGVKGRRGKLCNLCHGERFVSEELFESFRNR